MRTPQGFDERRLAPPDASRKADGGPQAQRAKAEGAQWRPEQSPWGRHDK